MGYNGGAIVAMKGKNCVAVAADKRYELNEGRVMEPNIVGNLVQSMLYEKRFGPWFLDPIVAGLNDKNEPYVSGFDLIGASTLLEDFVAGGTSDEMLCGICKSFYQPNLEPEALTEVISQCLIAAVHRDCLAGWGGVVHIITPESHKSFDIKVRMD